MRSQICSVQIGIQEKRDLVDLWIIHYFLGSLSLVQLETAIEGNLAADFLKIQGPITSDLPPFPQALRNRHSCSKNSISAGEVVR